MAEDQASGVVPGALVSALRQVLRPLVRLLVARQILFPSLSNLLKSVYVEVAEQDFPLAGKRQTDSRISLLTGVHRKDVRRLRTAIEAGGEVPPVISLGAQLVARWNADLVDAEGSPLPLPAQSTDDQVPSFEALVRSVSKDIRPRSVLDEWLRLGVVRFDEQGRLVLDTGAFVPQKGFEEKLYYFGRNLHDHIAAAAHNVLGLEPPFVERSVRYGRLRRASVGELAELAEETGMRALREVNRRARTLQEHDAGASKAQRRIHFGIYFFEAPEDPAGEENVGPEDA
jgi:hypothetical protein